MVHYFSGVVMSGRGIGRKRMIQLQSFFDTHQHQFFPGTLNVVLDNPVKFNPETAPMNYNNVFLFWPIKLNGIDCWVYRWAQCPAHILEVVSEHCMRDTIEIDPRKPLEVSIESKYLKSLKPLNKLYWFGFWSVREKWFYTSDFYNKIVGKYLNLIYYIKRFLGCKQKLPC